MSYLGENIPKLGFGLMRLPLTDPDSASSVDMDRLREMVDLLFFFFFCLLLSKHFIKF